MQRLEEGNDLPDATPIERNATIEALKQALEALGDKIVRKSDEQTQVLEDIREKEGGLIGIAQ